jgi:hypothetical protein
MQNKLSFALALLFLAALVVLLAWPREDVDLEEEHRAEAQQDFAPVLEELAAAEAEVSSGAEPIDLDKTVRVLHEIDFARERAGTVEEYVGLAAGQDYRNVDPRVLAARKEIMDVLFKLYATQADAAEQEATWGFARRWMAALALTDSLKVDGELRTGLFSKSPSVGFDTKNTIEEYKSQLEHLGDLRRDLEGLQRELVEVTVRNAGTTHDVLADWDRLCLVRDRAYLAANALDWPATLQAAEEAIALAPLEKEAHLLKALALVEGDFPWADEQGELERLLEDFIQRHPDSSAPALLLRGVHAARRGRIEDARLFLQQSATNYPRQAEALTELLDPYAVRSRYLRKSREGNAIRELYKSTMLGASWFSPDLQLARLDFETGDFDAGQRKVMDHFARRRSQGQWDLILYDLRFCEDLLGDDYRRIFPEDVYLDLVIEPTLFGDGYQLSVINHSEETLHNATLVLCLQFTDMHPEDYEPFAAETAPQLAAHATTDFGKIDVSMELFGAEKGRDDVYGRRAILVSNEAVVWVDTIEFKDERVLAAGRERRDAGEAHAGAPAAPGAGAVALEVASELLRGALELLEAEVSLEVQPERLFADDVVIHLPKRLAVARPVFRLEHAGELHAPDTNEIVDGRIRLVFDGISEFEPEAGPLRLRVETLVATVVLKWVQTGPDAYALESIGLAD